MSFSDRFVENGKINTESLNEMVSKTTSSIVALLGILAVYQFAGAFEPFQEAANYFIAPYICLIFVRLVHLQIMKKSASVEDIRLHSKTANIFSLCIAAASSIMSGSVVYFHHDPGINYYTTFAVIGTMIGGATLYFTHKKFYLTWTSISLFIPVIALLGEGRQGYFLVATLALFYEYIRRITYVQNMYYFKAFDGKKLLDQVIESLPAPLSVLDENLKFVKVNSALTAYNKLEPDDYIGQKLGFYGGAENSAELIKFLTNLQKDPILTFSEKEVETVMGAKKSNFFVVASKIKGTKNIVCVSLDMTELKTAQAELEQSKAMGIEAVKMSSMGAMANSMAHEINNPLSIILGKTEQALRVLDKPETDTDYLKKSLNTISSNVSRIAQIVQGLRTISGEGSLEERVAKLKDIVDGSKLLGLERLTNAGITVEIEEPPEVKVKSNQAGISQVLLHLMKNSAEAIKQQDKAWIHIEFLESQDLLEIRFTDSGEGIPADLEQKIFHPFFTTKEIGKGMGLGLSVSKGIVESEGGEFFVDNTCKNTCFVIRLLKFQSGSAIAS